MKKVTILLVLFFLLGVFTLRNRFVGSEPIYCKYVDRTSKSFVASVKNKYGLRCSGNGGAFMDQVNEITLIFDSREKRVGVEDARGLIVNCAEEYLEKINDNEDVRPYLSHYPFTSKGVYFRISFDNEKEGFISMVSLMNDNVCYYVYDDAKYTLVKKHKESYEEARRLVALPEAAP